ncbi:MAG: winged helix-turn-helix domain-containing protein [Promethearchaeota archaeon]
MFNKRRSEIQIIGKILDISKNGAKKTEILYQNNMSFAQLQNYLSFLLDKSIIEENTVSNDNGSSNEIYVNTEKGNNLLEDINKLYKYFK